MKNSMLGVAAITLTVCLLACGEKMARLPGADLSRYFPETIEAAGLHRASEVRTFIGDSLWEYINGGAELYHSYGFRRVSTADYEGAELELLLDLYQFETSDGAYGLYTALRPDEPEIVELGVEGYLTGSTLEFVKGDIMVRLVGYDASESTTDAIERLAIHMSTSLTGASDPPETFRLFPEGHAIAYTDRIVGEAFLGHAFLNLVYTRTYQCVNDTVTLFVLEDITGEAFARWFQRVSADERSPAAVAELPYDEDYVLLTANSYYGDILAGLKNGKLAGVIGYSDQHRQFVSDWLATLPGAN